MSLPLDLLGQAKLLATKEFRRPRQASLRRSVSASYYALFHLLVDAATRRLVWGNERQELRNCLTRAFDHGVMKRPAPSSAHVAGFVADAAIVEAATQNRRLLCVAPTVAKGAGNCEKIVMSEAEPRTIAAHLLECEAWRRGIHRRRRGGAGTARVAGGARCGCPAFATWVLYPAWGRVSSSQSKLAPTI